MNKGKNTATNIPKYKKKLKQNKVKTIFHQNIAGILNKIDELEIVISEFLENAMEII